MISEALSCVIKHQSFFTNFSPEEREIYQHSIKLNGLKKNTDVRELDILRKVIEVKAIIISE